MKLSRKRKNTCLALAVVASILGGGSVFAEAANYTDTLTGDKTTDTAYADVIDESGVYNFIQDSQITAQVGMNIVKNTTINADGRVLTFNVKDVEEYGAGIRINKANSLSIKADTLKMNLKGEGIYADGLQGIRLHNTGASLTVDGNIDITADGDLNTVGIYSQGNVDVIGDVKLDIEGNGEGSAYYGASGLYATSQMKNSKGGTINISGNVDFKGNANGLFVNAGGSKINVAGGQINVLDYYGMGYAAIRAENGIVNMNVVQDKDGNVTGAGSNDVIINGNLSVSTGAVASVDEHGTKTEINLGLTTEKSKLNGVIQNAFDSEGNVDNGVKFTGAANLWLQNGATWNNENKGTVVLKPEHSNKTYSGSEVTNFVGGSDDKHAGNIFQKDSNNLNIYNYSGYTNIFYSHEGNGEAAENYKAGDTIIKSAVKGSVVNLITDNYKIDTNNDASVANVLNALAGKLTYSSYVNGESNLTGYVKIADGLTASSKAMQTGDITFNKDNGKGTYVKSEVPPTPQPEPVEPPKTEFTTVLTGDAATDTEYAGNIKDGKYIFAADTTIKADAESAVEVKAPLNIDAGNNKLVMTAKKGKYVGATALFKQNVDGTSTIKADKLVIKNGTNDFNERSGMEVTKGNVDITADVDMKLSSMSNAYGIYVKANGSSVAIHGDLDLADTEQFDSINGLYVENAVEMFPKTSAITVDGKANINLHNGDAVSAIRNGSTVTVGGGNIKVAKNDKKEIYALKSDGGVVNVNMNADKNAAGTATTVIEGNISAFGEKAEAAYDMDVTNSIINIGLSDKDSSWTGTAFAKDKGTGYYAYRGIVNLYLANGATWNNEAWGKTNAAFEGSHVAKLAGGASAAAAGNIFQKDSNNLTIDNYSGNTNIFYAHTGNGENASNYVAGDTIIKSAAAGSAVSLITDNTGISMNNDASVANVLNALAGKLTYSNFVNGENNLSGYVKIADGLTASSHTMKSDTIKFNKDTGKGYTKEETIDPGEGEKTTFTDAITGEKQGVFSAVQQEDLSYVFAEDASININQMTHKEKDPTHEGSFIISGAAVQNAAGVENLVIKAEDKTLKLNVALGDKTVPPDKNAGILNNRIPLRGIDNSIAGSTTSITAGTLDINIDNTYSRTTSSGNPLIGAGSIAAIYANSTGDKASVTVNGNTVIKAHGHNNVYGVNANGNSEIKLNGDLTMAKNGDKWAIENVIDGKNTTTLAEASWRNIAGINANGAGASVTVDGKTTIAAHGSGAIAADGATVTLGAADIEIMNNSDEKGYAYHAVGAALGTVNVGDEGKTVTVKGNAGLFGKQDQKFASDSKESVINLKLTTADSSWTGVAYKHFDAEKDAGLSGSMNLTLANGASWTNEKYGYTYGDAEFGKYKFTGSEIANFVGGASDAKAGNIFQKDSNSLTIDNYSGNTNIYYAHEGNGEAAENYKAGDTIIKHAAEGSVVSLITDSQDINMKSDASVANVLNALAGKLTYSNFANEKNLTGYVKIADGLTASSKELKKGDIAFNEDGKGSLKKEDVKPEPPTPPTAPSEFNQGISGNPDKDKDYAGVIKDGKYVFEKDTEIAVTSGAAVKAAGNDIKIDNSNSKLVLKGYSYGINAEGNTVEINGVTEISSSGSANPAINAAMFGNVILDNGTTINGNIEGMFGGNISINKNEKPAATIINGNIDLTESSADIALVGSDSKMTGSYNLEDNSKLKMTIKDKAAWDFKGGNGNGLSIFGGANRDASGFIIMNDASGGATTYGLRAITPSATGMTIDNYSGWETFIYAHNNDGDEVGDYTGGNVTIKKADAGSGVILSTDSSGITMTDKNAVEAALKALAQKVTYNDHAANGSNLKGEVQIADGLTSSSVRQYFGTMSWNSTNGVGQYDDNSVNWTPITEGKITEGDYETFVMKGVRSAATTSMHTWRDNMQDTYTGADLADEDGMFAKALGGKTSSDVSGLKDSNSYYGVQVGYDRAMANGWHTGIAFDYRDGDSNYLLGGKGDNQMYSFGVYGVKNFDNNAFFRVAAKVGRVENEYDVYNEIRSMKLHGDYKSNAYGLTMEVGKTFGTEETYFTPKAQLTWSQVGAKDYTASTGKAEMQIEQDSYSSFVGRMGFEAGIKSAKGRVYAGLFAAHEFNGDISANYFANDGDAKHTSFNGEDTWMEMKLGGTYDFSKSTHLYADIAKDFGGDFERKWKLNAGLRFEF
ncbi:autotransporter outer membrane beta-barrel domain-containing protein [Phascolarctobacterium sp.]|uniref:autotransporter outer membrane beta-barrel domain-containing protein n=1 Tax=Phascolarctobacterium sp. TaxID=2049039 RepID=UPI0025EDFDF3|nr:autotransporter outer membrane beta-barrel domain-containing protein [Phascolarctobacterium sp.]